MKQKSHDMDNLVYLLERAVNTISKYELVEDGLISPKEFQSLCCMSSRVDRYAHVLTELSKRKGGK